MAILELALEELCHGSLASAFADGAVAAVVRCKGEVRRLWSQLLEDESERLPWELPMMDMARNYHGSRDITCSLGDLFYFQPGHHAYIARKIELSRDSADGSLQARPDTFAQGNTIYRSGPQAFSGCWSLADRIMMAVTPKGMSHPPRRVAVQRLKYQKSGADFDRLAAMTGNSLGRCGRLGFSIDAKRSLTAGPFRRKWLSDMLGTLMLTPMVRHAVHGLNGVVARNDSRMALKPGQQVFEAPHYDTRYFSGLCGLRDGICTQVYMDGRWEDLPVGLDSIAVLPGILATKRFGYGATLHRVLHNGDQSGMPAPEAPDSRTANVTLLIGAT